MALLVVEAEVDVLEALELPEDVVDDELVEQGLVAPGLPGGPVWVWLASPQPHPGFVLSVDELELLIEVDEEVELLQGLVALGLPGGPV